MFESAGADFALLSPVPLTREADGVYGRFVLEPGGGGPSDIRISVWPARRRPASPSHADRRTRGAVPDYEVLAEVAE